MSLLPETGIIRKCRESAAGHPETRQWWKTRKTWGKLELPEEREICFVAQTTFNYNKFEELVEILSKKRYDIHVINTVCNATEERQSEAAQIASQVDVMLVIGGRHSSNTQKLFEICRNRCKNTYFVETLDDLDI